MKELKIRWQRLVDENGETCDRCGMTETAVDGAVKKLQDSVKVLGIEIILEKEVIVPSKFLQDTLESNRIWIAGKSLEEWLSATSGQSKCCSTCGDSDCRTITVDEKTYEAIPEELIVKAGLLAAAELLGSESEMAECRSTDSSEENCGCC